MIHFNKEREQYRSIPMRTVKVASDKQDDTIGFNEHR
jgi:hypothetical protein